MPLFLIVYCLTHWIGNYWLSLHINVIKTFIMQNKIVLAALMILGLGACNSTTSEKSKIVSESKMPVAVGEAAAASSDALESVMDSSAVTLMKQTDDPDRITIKEGSLQVNTNDCKKYTLDLSRIIKANNGHTSNYNFSQNRYLHTTQDFTKDSMYEVYKITPVTRIAMRIPAANKDEFVEQVMQLNGTIINFTFAENDVTQEYDNAINTNKLMTNKKAGIKEYDDAQQWTNNTTTPKELLHKQKYYWCQADVNGNSYEQKIAMVKPNSYNTPLGLSLTNALARGWQLVGILIVGLAYIWPFILISTIGILIYKRDRKSVIKAA
jgi:hypothetical protein